MDTFLKADIFFVITTFAVVILTLVVLVLLYFAFKLVRVLTQISEVVRDEAKLIKEDIDGARGTIRANAEVVGTVIGAFARSAGASVKKARKKSSE